jgi:hypothetical protein
MPILAVHNQSFASAQATTYNWSWQLNRIMKTSQSSRFAVVVSHFANYATTAPTITTPIIFYISSPELCANVGSICQNTAGTQVRTNKFAVGYYVGNTTLNTNTNNRAIFICNDFPTNPILLNYEYAGTQGVPNNTIQFMLGLTIYEFEGDIPDVFY